VDCSKGVSPVDVPKSTDHSEGDVHPYGNPHYMLDPVLAKTAVQNICDALVAVAPDHATDFTKNRDDYLAKLDAKIAGWQAALAPFKGTKFVSYHEHWPYFAARFGLVYYGTIELKPGVDPTPRHIENLIAAMKADHVPLVVREPQFPEKVPALIAKEAGAKLVKLPIMPGGVPNSETYIAELDYIVNTIADALKK
jgi:ABC-type Zn uptake system ZnuABC Zn-binding protein ZnuA